MLVREVMHPAGAVVQRSAGLGDAARAILQSGFDCLPVLDSDRVVGMITSGAIVGRLVVLSPELAESHVDEVMTSDGVYCRDDIEVDAALRQMEARHVTRMVVVDGDGHALGVVARDDVSLPTGRVLPTEAFIQAYLDYYDPVTGR